MELVIPPAALVPFGLRALKMVAMANGELADRERDLLAAAQRMFRSDHDIDQLPSITPQELADRVTDPALRLQLVRGMLMMSLIDGEASPAEADVVESFRTALEVDRYDIDTFRKLADGHIMAARFDILRRFWAREHIVAKIKEEGAGWAAKAIASFLSIATDGELAAKYRALEGYAAGSLGRAYYDFIVDNDFSMPGEKGSPPEVIIIHDLTHVLGDYGTDPAGEIYVTAFHAGYRKVNPFTWIMFSMMQFNLGHRITPLTPGTQADFEPAAVMDAVRRGAAMNADLTDGSWDYWQDLAQPIDDVRRRFNIQPKGTFL